MSTSNHIPRNSHDLTSFNLKLPRKKWSKGKTILFKESISNQKHLEVIVPLITCYKAVYPQRYTFLVASAFRRICFYDPIQTHPRSISEMTEPIPIPSSKSEPALDSNSISPEQHLTSGVPSTGSSPPEDSKITTFTPSENGSPHISRRPSASGSSTYQEDWEPWPPLDKITILNLLENFALPQQLEKIQKNLSAQSQKLDRYKKRMRDSVDKLGTRWNDTKSVTIREKVSFICGVLNVLISGYLIGGYPELFHWWYTAQLLYFMPIRFYAYHKRGYHYFLADLCYFTNFLCFLSIWIFPQSKRLFISTYCLSMGNNAVAIAMWRNSMVFHSFDKVTSLFIHIMPCVTLHCLVHLIDPSIQQSRFSAIYNIRTSPVGSSTHYSLLSMALWSSIPYAVWQLSYHFLITVRRREKIAAGRPTSFTWLRKSYSKAWIGKAVLALPDSLQEPAFMLIQYSYALLTMLPCPLWFWYSVFQNELEEMKREVQKWHSTTELTTSPLLTPRTEGGEILGEDDETKRPDQPRNNSLEKIPLLNDQIGSTGIDGGARDVAKPRKAGDAPA
ncbi:hypothetical protein EYC84_007718 [Monilinia fructicola]|uniref:Glycerophosphocholine acyltransferase 1 n=1 Tax=Monilinia fructicola TaxID=38448 RepID=A0A5M9JL63_MONFR|nr:hypothetical protein EYC84_007718 [Monilinia fructicola]